MEAWGYGNTPDLCSRENAANLLALQVSSQLLAQDEVSFQRCHDVTHAMLSKNKKPYDPNALQPHARYRRHIQDLYADNALSSSRIQELFDDAHDAGIEGLRDVRSNASSKHANKCPLEVVPKFCKGITMAKTLLGEDTHVQRQVAR